MRRALQSDVTLHVTVALEEDPSSGEPLTSKAMADQVGAQIQSKVTSFQSNPALLTSTLGSEYAVGSPTHR